MVHTQVNPAALSGNCRIWSCQQSGTEEEGKVRLAGKCRDQKYWEKFFSHFQWSQELQWFCSSTFPFPFSRGFIPSGNRSGLVGTGGRALMGWFGSQGLGIYVGESWDITAVTNPHIWDGGTKPWHLLLCHIRGYRSPENTTGRRM